MAGVLLALFPVLLMFHTPAAFVALALAIMLLVRHRVAATRRVVRPRVEEDWSA